MRRWIDRLTDAVSEETAEYSGAQLAEGIRLEMPMRSGRLCFYEAKKQDAISDKQIKQHCGRSNSAAVLLS